MNGSTEAHPSATIRLYKDKDKTQLYDTCTIDSGTSTTSFITFNPDPSVTYYAYEDFIDGYTSSTGGEVCMIKENSYAAAFTNTLNDTNTDTNTVTAQTLVQWANDDFAYRPSSVSVTLCRKDGTTLTPISSDSKYTVTLKASNSWYYAWSGLPKTDANGTAITYSYIETNPSSGYVISTEPHDPPLVIGNLTSTIFNNTYQTTSFTANASIINGISTSKPSSLTMQLQQSTDSGTTYTDYGSPVTVNEAGSWSYSWSSLPTYTADNKKILYQAVETVPEGYTLTTGTVAESDKGAYSQSFTNTFGETKVTVSDTSTGTHPKSTKIILKGINSYGYSDVIDTCILNETNHWTYDFTDLPAYDAAGNPVTYSTLQSDATPYTTTGGTLTGSAEDGYQASFENTLQTVNFTSAVSLVNGINTVPPASITLQLQQSLDHGKTYTNYGEPVVVNRTNDWTGTWESLPAYTASNRAVLYQAVETAPEKYNVTAGTVTGSITKGYTQSIVNTYGYTKLTVSDVSTGTRPSSTTITLNKNGSSYATCKLSADNKWAYTFNDLPILDEDGNVIVYTLAQTTVQNYTTAGGTLIGTSEAGYTVSFTNRYVPEATVAPTASPSSESSTEETVTEESVPDTNDGTNLLFWFMMVMLSCGAAAFCRVQKKHN